jgi:damage-control phosphatase, subfamily I
MELQKVKLNLDCIPCFQRQALQAVRFVSDDEELHQKVLREVAEKLLESNWDATPPELAHEVHRIVKRRTNENDPYKKVKKESNDAVLKMYPSLKKQVEESSDPLRTAIRLAIAGNIIDFGPLQKFNLDDTVREVLKKQFAIDDYKKLKEKLDDAETLLFFTDNAGEIGFDKLLVETFLKTRKLRKIRFVVKGGPIINDATLEDAVYMGLSGLPNVEFLKMSNGEVGAGPERNSQTVKTWIEKHDLVISKGQGNYEGLSEHNDLFFLFMAKCPVIASDVGVNVGDIILKHKQ